MPGYIIDKERKAARARSASVNDSSSSRNRASKKGEYEMLMVGRDRGSKSSAYLMVPQWRGHADDEPEYENEKDAKNVASITTRQRSASAAVGTSSSKPKEFAEGLKRRIGSLRRK